MPNMPKLMMPAQATAAAKVGLRKNLSWSMGLGLRTSIHRKAASATAAVPNKPRMVADVQP